MNRRNMVFVEGNLVSDPRVNRFSKVTDGKTYESIVANLRIASHGGRSGEDDETLYLDVELWGSGATAVSELRKGDVVRFEGCLRNKEWKDKTTGEKVKSIILRAQHFSPIYLKNNVETLELQETA